MIIDVGLGGSPGGSDTQIQFNNAGVFGGSANLSWTAATQTINVTNSAQDGSNFIQGFEPGIDNGSPFGLPATLAGGMSVSDPAHGGISFTGFSDGLNAAYFGTINFTAFAAVQPTNALIVFNTSVGPDHAVEIGHKLFSVQNDATPNFEIISTSDVSASVDVVVSGRVNATDFINGLWQGKTLTLSGNLVTTGAFNPTFAIPSSSTWTFPSGGGTLLIPAPLLSTNATDATAGSVARGDLITGQGATPKWVRLAKGTANQVLAMDGTATDVVWATPAAGGVTSIATTSPISGGTITSTGTISLLVNTDFAWTVPQSVTNAGIAATSTDGFTLLNTTPATSIVPVQQSPRLRFRSQVWNTTSVAATNTNDFFIESVPVSALVPTGLLKFGSSLNGAAATYPLTVGSGGHVLAGTDGTTTTVTYGRIGNANTGLYFPGSNLSAIVSNGTECARFNSGINVGPTNAYAWGADLANKDTFLLRGGAAATVQHGADVNGAAVNQTIQAANGITGTDKTGGNLTINSGKGTGAGAVSSLIFQTPTVLTTGTTAQSLATRLTISSASLLATVPIVGGANYREFTEMTAPAAGGADTVRLYAVDNGAGKTQLMALFSSGAAQQIAIQP